MWVREPGRPVTRDPHPGNEVGAGRELFQRDSMSPKVIWPVRERAKGESGLLRSSLAKGQREFLWRRGSGLGRVKGSWGLSQDSQRKHLCLESTFMSGGFGEGASGSGGQGTDILRGQTLFFHHSEQSLCVHLPTVLLAAFSAAPSFPYCPCLWGEGTGQCSRGISELPLRLHLHPSWHLPQRGRP